MCKLLITCFACLAYVVSGQVSYPMFGSGVEGQTYSASSTSSRMNALEKNTFQTYCSVLVALERLWPTPADETRHRSGSALAVWDLGIPEPDWSKFEGVGSSTSKAIEIPANSTTQVWGTVSPGESAGQTLCKWRSSPRNNGAGDCRTDISWLHSAVGIEKSFFDDALANYFLRFHMQGACYRSSQVEILQTVDVMNLTLGHWYLARLAHAPFVSS
jgi:hypothetical protein